MLNTQQRQQTKYFVGFEVEHTICYGKKTLFVVGVQPLDEIEQYAINQECDHVYFGTSQSFKPKSSHEWKEWDNMIRHFLKKDFWVTLDFDIAYANEFHDDGWCEFNRFVPMISVKLPYINLYNYNTTIKLDDVTWGATNPGVWTHHLPTLMSKEKYTHWDQYTQDENI
jgi:hypothetical protein